MIIQCPKCLTKFKLDDSKVADEGTRVRCAKCKEVFVVKKEMAPSPPPIPTEPPSEKEEFDFSEGPAAEKEKALFGFEEGFEEEHKEEESEEDAFSFGGSLSEETRGEEEKGASFDFGGMSYGEVDFSEPAGTRPKTEEGPLGFEFKAEVPPFGQVQFIEEEPGERTEVPLHLPSADETAEFRKEGPVAGGFEEENQFSDLDESGFPDEFPSEFRKEKRRSLLQIASLLIVICAVAVAVFLYLKQHRTAETGEINLVELNGYYTRNAEAGNVFVVSGRTVNNTNKARSFFQIKGTLFNKKGEKLTQKEVYCGNIFSTKEITTLPKSKIEADLKNKVGGSLSNINLAPGKSVPFMIVFFDLPADMSEFTAEITGSQPAAE